ncbi:aminotransferase class V-fold PLP-dependent enzyme [Celeribacter sp. PS-C1]|uniref:pyridoxal phosphate-dependent decarboxylase family protein n=1 Tax=Celeribacter sp. PS-C1 TaxID=2820813 RepID=UPI001CA49FCA|nr:aminotransferase class V-fold PLP-dependent enzyme [Celeribacter sp. PS-C1]MBW6417647.1 aminotransferase class V-fold PLP-dependent enzyme [Celeribacter sp. PS-C1]
MNMPRRPADHASDDLLVRTSRYCQAYRTRQRPIDPTVTPSQLRESFCLPLSEHGEPAATVIEDLIAAAEPGLVGSTDPNFFAWVIGGSDPVGVAADWLTSTWGQNAAIYQSSPAAAVAEEAVASWLLDLLDLPRASSVGLVNGATMATFVGLAAARDEVLRRHGHDYATNGLQGAPLVRIYLSDDAHVANYAALRQLGFGEVNIHKLPSNAAGLMRAGDLARAMEEHVGPKIVIAQAGHINSGGFEPLAEIANIARTHDAWMHVDGAFGLWARASTAHQHLTDGAELGDSWSVDGHKWLQIPYASGFAIVRHPDAHRRAMSMNAGYLNSGENDGRSPSAYVPELSRRAKGFAAWAVLRHLGRQGIEDLVERHCAAAKNLASRIEQIDGLSVLNEVTLNQIIVGCEDQNLEDRLIPALSTQLNERQRSFVRTARWKGRTILRLSIISKDTETRHTSSLANEIATAWQIVTADAHA